MSIYSDFRKAKDDSFAHDPHSPLTPQQRNSFTGLSYFPDHPELNLVVEVERFPEGDEITMQTSTGDLQVYRRFGRFKFNVEGELAELTIFANQHGYFLPFVDSQANKETYGAGRYLEPEELADGRFAIDFNLAYNPYCAYNDRWSCPLTPFENRLKVAIPAGEKNFSES